MRRSDVAGSRRLGGTSASHTAGPQAASPHSRVALTSCAPPRAASAWTDPAGRGRSTCRRSTGSSAPVPVLPYEPSTPRPPLSTANSNDPIRSYRSPSPMNPSTLEVDIAPSEIPNGARAVPRVPGELYETLNLPTPPSPRPRQWSRASPGEVNLAGCALT